MKTKTFSPVLTVCAATALMLAGLSAAQSANDTGTTSVPSLAPTPAADTGPPKKSSACGQRVETILSPCGGPPLRGNPESNTALPISLQGTVTRQSVPAASLSATIDREVKRKFKGPPSKFLAVTLHLTNPTSDSLILEGDHAIAYYGQEGQVQNASEKQAVDDADSALGLTKSQKIAVAAVTMATATIAGPLFYEWIQGGASNPKLSLGKDEIRRRIEGVRLGNRLMLPNEQADGTVFLPASDGMPSYITIPILTYPSRQPAGTLRVDIGPVKPAPAVK